MMIDSLVIKSEIHKNKENELIKKEREELNETIKQYKRYLSSKNGDIKNLI